MMESKTKRDLMVNVQSGDGEQLPGSFWTGSKKGLNNMRTALTDRQMLTDIFADLEAGLKTANRFLSPYDAHMASFHLDLLKREFLKQQNNGAPGADIMMMAGTWLQTRVSNLAPALLRLWLAVPAQEVISRAGYSLEMWVNARAIHYVADGVQINLRLLRNALLLSAGEGLLGNLSEELGFDYHDLYGFTEAEKAQELLALSVRHGRAHQLKAILQPQSGRALA